MPGYKITSASSVSQHGPLASRMQWLFIVQDSLTWGRLSGTLGPIHSLPVWAPRYFDNQNCPFVFPNALVGPLLPHAHTETLQEMGSISHITCRAWL